jgi:hypothetical protein
MGWQPSSTKEMFLPTPVKEEDICTFTNVILLRPYDKENKVAKYEYVNKKIDISIKI